MGSYSPGCSGEAIGEHLQDLWKWERSDHTPKCGWWYGVELIMINQYMRAKRAFLQNKRGKQTFCVAKQLLFSHRMSPLFVRE